MSEEYCNKCDEKLKNIVSGQAFTRWNCVNCGESQLSPNTIIHSLCDECSHEFNRCKHCAGSKDK